MSKIYIERIEQGLVFFEHDNQAQSCCAWQLSDCVSGVQELHCSTDFVYLTTMEADATLINWFRAMEVGGKINLTLPDSDYYARMWLDAEWNEIDLRNADSDARAAFSGLFGAQQGSNPKLDGYSTTYGKVNKSAYNAKRLTFLLERAGFVNVEVTSRNGTLTAQASKTMKVGERQISTNYDNIRLDHKNRYQFACDQLRAEKPQRILDLACGIGYGTLMLANATGANAIGVDIDEGAIQYANQYYCSDNTQFIQQDARKLTLDDAIADAIVSFETIEHVDFDVQLLCKFHTLLKPGGWLICSTPNEDVMPFSKKQFSFHVRHYRVSEITKMIEEAGFTVEKRYTQMDPVDGEVVEGDDGCFTILKCRKS
jgi:ubiquinone/menaquinone biosynthesis C-methylase UbiE